MTVSYDRYHGTDNDFVVIDADEYVPDRSALAREVCESTGVDGVLFLALEAQYSPPRVIMTLVQPDGSNAAMCGNGARCAAHWAAERTGANVVMLDTQAGTHRATVDGERVRKTPEASSAARQNSPSSADVSVEMRLPSFAPEAVPLARDEPLVEGELCGFAFTAVNTGVPHAVAFVPDVNEIDVETVAPAIRHHEVFPVGANVTFAARTGPAEFAQRTFERGVEGETRSCGTGAVAVAAVARCLGLLAEGRPARVHPPGGELEVVFDEAGVATLHGPVEHEHSGQLETVPGPRRLDVPEA